MSFHLPMPQLKPDGKDFAESVIQRGRKVGLWIREGQARENIKKADLAKLTGISATYIGILTNNCYEKSKDRIIRPSQAKIRKIADALGISPALGMDAAGWKASADDLKLFPLDTNTLATFVTKEGVVLEYLASDEEFKETVRLAMIHAKKRKEGV